MPIHSDGGAVRERQVVAVTELLDEAENVIPAAAIQTCRVILQLEQNLIHFKRRRQCFDQYRGADSATGNAQRILGEVEYAIPQPRFAMALHLGQIKIRATPAFFKLSSVMKEVQTKIEQRARDRLTLHQKMLLHQVPSTRAHEQGRGFVIEFVLLAFRT